MQRVGSTSGRIILCRNGDLIVLWFPARSSNNYEDTRGSFVIELVRAWLVRVVDLCGGNDGPGFPAYEGRR